MNTASMSQLAGLSGPAPDLAALVWAWFGVPKGPTRGQTTFRVARGIDVQGLTGSQTAGTRTSVDDHTARARG